MQIYYLDCGVKENILRSLVGRGCSVTCFPYDYPIHKVAHHFDGVFISNGPGDPTHWYVSYRCYDLNAPRSDHS